MMKVYCKFIIRIIFIAICICSCNKDDIHSFVSDTDNHENYYITNSPLPYAADSLKILSIGNSFSIDGTTLLPNIINATDIKSSKYSIYILVKSSSSLENVANAIQSNQVVNTKITDQDGFSYQHIGGKQIAFSTEKQTNFCDILSMPWDVIVLQQYSRLSTQYSSFEPYLTYILSNIKKLCTNKNVTIAWHQTWSYASSFESHPRGENDFITIAQTTIEMVNRNGIDVIIPAGTTIQNLRNTKYNNDMDLTRDGIHLDMGIGRFAAALTWYKTLFKPLCRNIDESINISKLKLDSMTIDSTTLQDCMKYVDKSCQNPFWVYKNLSK